MPTAKTTKKAPTKATNLRQDTRKAAMLQALKATLGNVTLACQQAGIKDRHTHYNWLKKDPDYKEVVEAVSEEAIDFAENALFKAIKGGDTTATIFFLKTRGKKRGYSEKADIDMNGTLTIECGFDE